MALAAAPATYRRTHMHTAPCADEEYTLPSVEALLAGTLALLTGYAQSAPDCAHRPLMARKVVSNLFFHAAPPPR
mgnify:CR=1 FL=1